MFGEMMKIRWLSLSGAYHAPVVVLPASEPAVLARPAHRGR